MLKREDLMKQPEYWLEKLQNEIFRQVVHYIEKNGITQTQFAEKLGVSKGYISQVMKGEFNYTLKKLIELSLAVEMAPMIEFRPLDEFIEKKVKQADFKYQGLSEFSFGKGRFIISNNIEMKTSEKSNMGIFEPIAA